MTRRTNARIAGFTLLFYIAAGVTEMVVFGRATSGAGTAAKLASMAQHTTDVRIAVLLGFLECLSALVLAVTLYALTRDVDADLALLGLTCRVGEGLVGATNLKSTLGLLWLATAGTGTAPPDATAVNALGTFLLKAPGGVGAALFAVGSTIFCCLLLRGRMIPIALAWLGVLGSVLLVVLIPLDIVGYVRGPITAYMWIPMAVFEVTVAVWFIFKGVVSPAAR